MQALSNVPIVLTATIQPNISGSSVADPNVRRLEYLRAIDFYRQHTETVIVLENSSIPERWQERFADSGVQLVGMPPSSDPERGKGFSEFEMLDRWLGSLAAPPTQWLKITGRYIVSNVAALLHECSAEKTASMLIDQSVRTGIARTHVFWVKTSFYLETIAGLYKNCDDKTGEWIERVLFRRLVGERERCRYFRHRQNIRGVSGATGAAYPSDFLGHKFKQLLRNGNRLLDRRYLWFSR